MYTTVIKSLQIDILQPVDEKHQNGTKEMSQCQLAEQVIVQLTNN